MFGYYSLERLQIDDLLSNFNYSGNSRVISTLGLGVKCSHTAHMFGYYSLERLQKMTYSPILIGVIVLILF